VIESVTSVRSPCTGVCQIDPASGLCAGCLRTLDEIAAWSVLDDDARRAVWIAIARRRASGDVATGTDGAPR
jgi:predicted Fe-S protein YdhL (DUF1289 family)